VLRVTISIYEKDVFVRSYVYNISDKLLIFVLTPTGCLNEKKFLNWILRKVCIIRYDDVLLQRLFTVSNTLEYQKKVKKNVLSYKPINKRIF